MSLTAGTVSLVTANSNSVIVSATTATMGTAPYTYQWYISTTTGFTPGAGTLVSGATALTNQSISGLAPNTVYYAVIKATDSASPAATANSSQLAITTVGTTISQNALVQSPVVGQPDMNFNYNSLSVQADSSLGTGLLYPGQLVKIVTNTAGGIPRVVGCTGITDSVIGVINYNLKDVSFAVGQRFEISSAGNVIWLYATAAITQGARVCLDYLTVGGVQPTGATANVVGWAMDGAAAAGTLIRVALTCPSFANA